MEINNMEPVTCAMRERGKEHKLEFGGDIANALTTVSTTSMVAIPIKMATKQGYAEVPVGGVFDFAFPGSNTRRGRVQGGGLLSPTVTCEPTICVYEGTIKD